MRRIAGVLVLLTLMAVTFVLPTQAHAAQQSGEVRGRIDLADATVFYEGYRDEFLYGWGLKGPYTGDYLSLGPSDRPARNYRAKKNSRILASIRVEGNANNLILEIVRSVPRPLLSRGEMAVAYVEYADGTTEVKYSDLRRTALEDAAGFPCDRSGAVYTFAAEILTDIDENTPHFSDIQRLAMSCVSTGFPDGTFHALDKVRRADMAAFLRRTAKMITTVGYPRTWEPTEEDWSKFKDVDRNTPHAEDILWLAHTGISTGFGDGTFRPFAEIARCDTAAFLYRLYNLAASGSASDVQPGAGENTFKDVDGDTPHVHEVLWLANSGISTGFPDSTFRPYDAVARCDMAAFLCRLYDATKA